MAQTAARSPTAHDAGRVDGWSEMIAGGMAAWSALAQLTMEAATAQAKTLADFYAGGFGGLAAWPSQQQVLLMLEHQADQLADGCRHTLEDLGSLGGGPPTPVLPD